jgi:hypothetical protein
MRRSRRSCWWALLAIALVGGLAVAGLLRSAVAPAGRSGQLIMRTLKGDDSTPSGFLLGPVPGRLEEQG